MGHGHCDHWLMWVVVMWDHRSTVRRFLYVMGHLFTWSHRSY